jgi:hypothetical protein
MNDIIQPEDKDIAKFERRSPGVPQTTAVSNPAQMIELAVNRGADLEKVEKLMELQFRWDAEQAKKAYVAAMAAFKANPPEILKTAHVSYQKKDGTWVEYDHAVLGEIAEAINIGMAEHNLYPRWDISQLENKISVTCIVTHDLGHSETYGPITAGPDTSGGKNEIQGISSTNTYLQRISLLGITGLGAKGMDDDGNAAAEPEYIDDKQLSSITDMILAVEADETKFLKYIGAESLEKIPAKKFSEAMVALKSKKKPTREPGSDDD